MPLGADIDPRVLIPGWAGGLEPDEIVFVHRELKNNPAVQKLWGFTVNRITKAGILRVSEWGKPSDASHNRRLVTVNPTRRGIRAGNAFDILQAVLPTGYLTKEDIESSVYEWEKTPSSRAEFWESLRRNSIKPPL